MGHLADRLIGLPPLSVEKPANARALSREEVLALQRGLNSLGFDAGEADGVIGPATRAAVKRFEKAAGLPPDGYATPDLLEAVRAEDAPRAQ